MVKRTINFSSKLLEQIDNYRKRQKRLKDFSKTIRELIIKGLRRDY